MEMTQPMPIVADTNLFVAAGFNKGSASRRIVEALRDGRLLQVWNEATRRETVGVVKRIPPLDAGVVEPLFREEGRFVGPTSEEGLEVIEDVSDRKFAALARACGVILITNDSDFLEVREALELTAMTPSEYVKRKPPRGEEAKEKRGGEEKRGE